MVGDLGRIRAIPGGWRSSTPSDRRRDDAECIRDTGAVSFLDCDPADRLRRDYAKFAGSQAEYLAAQLVPLAENNAGAVANRLLFRFGSIGGVVCAHPQAIRECAQPGETWHELFIAARELFVTGLEATVSRSLLDCTDARFRTWLRAQFLGFSDERLLGVFCDSEDRLIAWKWLALGEGPSIKASARHIVQCSFDLGASSIILAHNHPSGNANASQEDVHSTLELRKLTRSLGIELRDHLILADKQITSMVERGLL